MANVLTGARLFLVPPTALTFARPEFLDPRLLLVLVCLAIATDYFDGKVARKTQTASPQGQLFDHSTDFVFVTAGLTGTAIAGATTPLLPTLIVIAFGQYVLDSYFLHRQKRLRMSTIGRWNGILYFLPLLLVSVSRLRLSDNVTSLLLPLAAALSYALALSTTVSVIDRAAAASKLD